MWVLLGLIFFCIVFAGLAVRYGSTLCCYWRLRKILKQHDVSRDAPYIDYTMIAVTYSGGVRELCREEPFYSHVCALTATAVGAACVEVDGEDGEFSVAACEFLQNLAVCVAKKWRADTKMPPAKIVFRIADRGEADSLAAIRGRGVDTRLWRDAFQVEFTAATPVRVRVLSRPLLTSRAK